MLPWRRILFIGYLLVIASTEMNTTFNTNVTIHECSRAKLTLSVDNAAEGGIIFIQGTGSACLQTTTEITRNYEFNFNVCNITYGTIFRVIVQQNPVIQTGFDKVIPVTCLVDLAEINVTADEIPGGVDDKSVNVTTTPTVHLKIYSSSNTDISGGGVVNLNDSIQMSITLDDEFSDSYDIRAKDCTAAMINILKDECSVNMQLFPNFQHSTRGELTTNFQVFQPTDLTGSEEVNVAFSCRIAICKGTCDEMDCGQTFDGKRKKRDVDKDEIDQISCGTIIKVIDPSKKLGKYQEHVEKNEQTEMEEMCIASFLVYVGITVVGFLFAMSWFLIGYLLKLRDSDREDRKINVGRSVGRRLTSMLNLPSGYDFTDARKFQTIPGSDETPPQKRKSVTTTKIDILPGE